MRNFVKMVMEISRQADVESGGVDCAVGRKKKYLPNGYVHVSAARLETFFDDFHHTDYLTRIAENFY